TFVYIRFAPRFWYQQSTLPSKALAQKKSLARIAHAADQRFHVIDISFQSFASGRGQAVFSLRRATCKRLCAAKVAGVLQLARVHAEVAVARLYRGLQLIESHRLMRRERADDSQPQTFV